MALDPNRLVKPVKKLRKLIDRLDRDPTPDEVHDLRTNTRRFEAITEALSLGCGGLGKSTAKNLGGIRKSAGKVRDMDVLTGYASTLHPEGEEECSVQLLEHLGAERRRHGKKLYAKVKRLRPDLRKALKRIPAILSKVIRENDNAPNGSSAAANATATALKLTAQLRVPRRLGKDSLHPYRLKVKELRNILQMGAGASHAKFIKDLGEVKDAIGEWHDWEELVSIAEKVLDHGSRCKLLAELKVTVKQKYEHALGLAETLRRKYLPDFRKAGAASGSQKIVGQPVWEAIALLAA